MKWWFVIVAGGLVAACGSDGQKNGGGGVDGPAALGDGAGERAVEREQLGGAGQQAVAVAQGLVGEGGEQEGEYHGCTSTRRGW